MRTVPPLSRRVVLLVAGLSMVVGLTLSAREFRSVPQRRSAERPPAVPSATAARAAVDTAGATRHETAATTLGRRGTLGAALDRLGIDGESRRRIIEALATATDLRRLPPETGLVATRDASGALVGLALRSEPERFLRARPGTDGGTLVVERIELPTVDEVRLVSGVVTHSVAEALADLPHGVRLTTEFAEIFQWDVDLLVDPRPGDRIRIVHEVRRLGAVPPDLPGLGTAASRSGEPIGPGRILAASYEGAMARADAFWVADGRGGGDYFDREGRRLRKSFLKSPLNYRRISSRFSRARRNPVTRRVSPHHGVDYAAAAGTPVVASADGRVVSTRFEGALGRTVRVRHGSEYVTLYGHLRAVARGIRPGVGVRQNQVVGFVGSTGRATGPHLHYTVLRSGRPIDPLRMKNPPVEPLDPALWPVLELAIRRWRDTLDRPGELRPVIAMAADDACRELADDLDAPVLCSGTAPDPWD